MKRLGQVGTRSAYVAVLALALIGALTVTRGTPVGTVVTLSDSGPPPVSDSLFERSFELFTGTHIFAGNKVEEALNGDGVYPRLWADLRSAQRTITVQMYYSLPGTVADTMAAVLKERARAHVRVLFLVDAFGSQHLHEIVARLARTMRASKSRELRKLRLVHDPQRQRSVARARGRGRRTGRLHRRIRPRRLLARRRPSRRAVARVERAVRGAGGDAAAGGVCGGVGGGDGRADHRHAVLSRRPGFSRVGPTHAGLLFTSPTTGSTPAERFLALSIARARKTLYITNSYFVPDDDFRRLLDARGQARRGRARAHGEHEDRRQDDVVRRPLRYEELLRRGIRIYEYQPTMMHSKTFVVDGMWGSDRAR